MYLLDTNTCIEVLRHPRTSLVARRLAAEQPQSIRLCSIVLGELVYGAYRSADVPKNLQVIAGMYAQFQSLPCDDRAAEIYGQLRADLSIQGISIGPNDSLIAAIALSNGLVLVTNNTKEFQRVPGLAIQDWTVP